jgi:murein L,D-transpeptidase YafK
MKKISLLLLMVIPTLVSFSPGEGFLSSQKKYPRVSQAFVEKASLLETLLKKVSLNSSDMHILIVAYKKERMLEVYAKARKEETYKKLATYEICASSGSPGPKRCKGDGQVPAGFYRIDRFNPNSNFYLSLGVNYPNASDKILGEKDNLGGDIFIHGDCVTVGCIPMTDDKIKEIYLLAAMAKNNGENSIPVYIFPCRLTTENLRRLEEAYASPPERTKFWRNLKEGYDLFVEKGEELKVKVDNRTGKYLFAK